MVEMLNCSRLKRKARQNNVGPDSLFHHLATIYVGFNYLLLINGKWLENEKMPFDIGALEMGELIEDTNKHLEANAVGRN